MTCHVVVKDGNGEQVAADARLAESALRAVNEVVPAHR
jgi:hypothetical protein